MAIRMRQIFLKFSAILLMQGMSAFASELPKTSIAESFVTFLSNSYELEPLLPISTPVTKAETLSPGGILSDAVLSKTSNGIRVWNLAHSHYCAPDSDRHSDLQASISTQQVFEFPDLLNAPSLKAITFEVIEPSLWSVASDVRARRERSAAERCNLNSKSSQVISNLLFGRIRITLSFRSLPSGHATEKLLEQLASLATFETGVSPDKQEITFSTRTEMPLAIRLRARQF
jgi:hypothetical protein